MTQFNSVLKNEEKIIFTLRRLYSSYGYSQYKMSKFEEYDLYVKNKDFLISNSIITFTGRGGKLMALKPDVTLSILKNGSDAAGCVQKVYYNENVYRPAGSTNNFKEIMQVGIECIGDIDNYCIYETLMLAAKSLASIAPEAVLDISDLGIIESVFNGASLPEEYRGEALRCIGEKNLHELKALCAKACLSAEDTELVCALITLYGTPDKVMPKLKELLCGKCDMTAANKFELLLNAFKGCDAGKLLRIDFSVVHDIRYYNGIVFKGFVRGIPESVVSGGQYDKLLMQMGRKSGAIGFAVYLDRLERLNNSQKQYDTDVLLIYNDDANISDLIAKIDSLSKDGTRVMAQKTVPEKITYKELIYFK